MESIYAQLALYGSKNECARTDTVFFPYLSSAMVQFPSTNSFVIGVLFPDKINLEILKLKVEIRSQGWDHLGHNPDKRTKYLHLFPLGAAGQNVGLA